MRRARKQAAKGDYAGAWILAEQAVARQPNDPSVRALADAYQRRGLQALTASAFLRPLPDARGTDPLLSESDLTERVLSEIDAEDRLDLAAPPELTPDRGRHSFELRAEPRTLIEKVAGAYGITPVFDYDFPATEVVRRLHLDDASWSDAIYALQLITNSFYVPVSTRVALFAKETAVKRGEVEPNVAVAIPFPETMGAQELQDVANAVRQAFGLTKVEPARDGAPRSGEPGPPRHGGGPAVALRPGGDLCRRRVVQRGQFFRSEPRLEPPDQLPDCRFRRAIRFDLDAAGSSQRH
jgi:hypothetical protein